MKKKPVLQKIASSTQVTLKDWLAMKPYKTPFFNYDVFYLKQCQTVYQYFTKDGDLSGKWDLSRSQLRELACQIVSYFEDYIVEIGIWRGFIETNKELYGYCLPFYDLEEYDEKYINIEDIAFLIWHYVTKYSPEQYIINPNQDNIVKLSQDIFNLFEDVMEQAPAVNIYDDIFTIKDNEDYFFFKAKMQWFSTESYLIGVDLGKTFDSERSQMAQEVQSGNMKKEHFDIVLYSYTERFLYKKRCSFSALNAPEWFAKVARCSQKRKQEIIDMTYWIDGKFFMKERRAKHFVFEHILTKIQYKARIDSFKNSQGLHPSNTSAYVMHLVRWSDEYWLSGMMSGVEMTADSIKNYKTAQLTTPWILPESKLEMMRESTDSMYESFLDFFKSPLAVFGTHAELDRAHQSYWEFHRNRIIENNEEAKKLSMKEAIKKFKTAFDKKEMNMTTTLQEMNFKESLGLFFIDKVGTYVCQGIAETVRDLRAYSLNGQKTADLFVSFANGYIPPICTYLLKQYGGRNLKYPTQDNPVDVVKHLPFFWRMNSPEEFNRVYPLMTLIYNEDIE
jgi:Protein of unknown function (DUF3843)